MSHWSIVPLDDSRETELEILSDPVGHPNKCRLTFWLRYRGNRTNVATVEVVDIFELMPRVRSIIEGVKE